MGSKSTRGAVHNLTSCGPDRAHWEGNIQKKKKKLERMRKQVMVTPGQKHGDWHLEIL